MNIDRTDALHQGVPRIMPGIIDARLEELGIELPEPSVPGANYVPYLKTGSLMFLTGQLCHWNGERLFLGKLGAEFDVAEGRKAARVCALNLISQLSAGLDGNLDRVARTVRLAGYVNSTPDFQLPIPGDGRGIEPVCGRVRGQGSSHPHGCRCQRTAIQRRGRSGRRVRNRAGVTAA